MGRRYSLDPLADLVTGTAEEEEESLRERPDLSLTEPRLEALDQWSKDPWSFLTGVDPDTGRPIIWTQDQRDKRDPVKAFPSHLIYLRYLLDLIEHEQYIQIEKASQMVITTTIALWAFWRSLFRSAHKTLLSKHKEEEASTILAEKIRIPWQGMPDWLRVALPITLKPANKMTAPKTASIILGLPENAAAADARGQTYNVGLIDEAEFQDALAALLSAMLPRAGQVIFWSTPAPGGQGAQVFRSYLKDDPIKLHPRLMELRKKYTDVKGMSLRRNEDKNVTICRIEHIADPEKRSKDWEETLAKTFPSMVDFRREIKIARDGTAGKPFYPAFAENPSRYMRRIPHLLDSPILRGWDFGRTPACVWGQWSKKSRRFWVLRELQGRDIDTYQFRDLVRYLSGQLSLESLSVHKRAVEMMEEIRMDRAYPPFPWFAGNNAFADFAGHEAVRADPGLVKAGDSRVAADILALGDIYVLPQYTFQRNRTQVINALARLREDGLPGILVDPACPFLFRGLTGEIVYAKGTPSNPSPNEPAKNDWSHTHEAVGYIVVNVVSLDAADFFATGENGELPPAELDTDESEIMDSYLTGTWE